MSSPEYLSVLEVACSDAATGELLLDLASASLDVEVALAASAAEGPDLRAVAPPTLKVYCRDPAEAEATAARLRLALAEWAEFLPGEARLAPGLGRLLREDWQESWKRHFHAQKVSARLVVKPSWAHWEAAPGEILLAVDPGMSFGTGQHETTRACLQLLDDLVAEHGPGAFLDLGCGSGILTVAAARLGCAPLLAMDHDADCLRTTAEQLARNDLAGAAELRTVDLAEFTPPRTFAYVAANILAPVLIAQAARIVAGVAPGGFLLLAGILREQYAEVAAAYAALGLREHRRLDLGEWAGAAWLRDRD